MNLFRPMYRLYEEGDPGGGGGGGDPATPPADPPATPPADPPATSPGGDWTAGLSEDLRGYVQTKGFKDPGAVAESYRNLEKLVNVPEDRLVKIPDADDAEGRERMFNQLGRPKDAKEYDLGEAVTDEQFGEWYRGVAHEIGLTNAQAKAFVEKMDERGRALQADDHMESQEAGQKAERELRAEWGAAYEKNAALVDRAASELGMTEAQIGGLREALGPADAMRFIHGLAHKMGEDNFISSGDGLGGKGQMGAMSPEQAQARIKDLRRDTEFANKLQKGDSDAKAEWDRLHRWAYPGDNT